jgi:hypothetical protein
MAGRDWSGWKGWVEGLMGLSILCVVGLLLFVVGCSTMAEAKSYEWYSGRAGAEHCWVHAEFSPYAECLGVGYQIENDVERESFLQRLEEMKDGE